MNRYPELGDEDEAVIGLIATEFALRWRLDPRISRQEYLKRFPQYGQRLERRLEQRLVSTGLPQIPGYDVLQVLGRGGMGVVYEARQIALGRRVALKTLFSGGQLDRNLLTRFVQEARSVAKLKHNSIVQIYEVGDHDGVPYFTMELVEGGTLSRWLSDSLPSPRAAAQLLLLISEAVQAAHDHDIIHRDLKPGNILLTQEEQPKISDFGLAKDLEGENQTFDGDILGTPGYMSPEQASGRNREVSPRTDVYALGAILYATLTGRPPFQSSEKVETLRQVLSEEPVPPTRIQSGIPKDLETICLKCLEKTPARRYRTAKDLAGDLQRFLDGQPILARPVGRMERLKKWAYRRPSLAALFFVSLLAVLIIGIGSALFITGLIEARDLADRRAKLANEANINTKKANQETKQALQKARDEGEKAKAEKRRAEERLELAREHLFTSQLLRLSGSPELRSESNYKSLYDCNSFPIHLREIAWRYFARWTNPQHGDEKPLSFSIDSQKGKLMARATGKPLLAAVDQRHTIHIWDVETQREVLSFCPVRVGYIEGISLSSDGSLLAISARLGQFKRYVHLYDLATGILLHTSKRYSGLLNELVFSSDGKLLCFSHGNHGLAGTVVVWDTSSGKERVSISNPGTPIFALSADGQLLANQSSNAVIESPTLQLRDTKTGKVQSSLLAKTRFGHLTSCSFSSDGQYLSAGDYRGKVYCWEIESKKLLFETNHHKGKVTSLCFSPSSRSIISASEDGTIRIWNRATGGERAVLPRLKSAVKCAWLTPGMFPSLVSLRDDDVVQLWKLAENPLLANFTPYSRPTYALAFSPDGALLATGHHDYQLPPYVKTKSRGEVRLWETKTGQLLDILPVEDGSSVSSLTFSPDGARLAVGSKNVKIWNVDRRDWGKPLPPDHLFGSQILYSPNGRFLVTRNKTEIWVRDGASSALVTKLSHPRSPFYLSPGYWFSPDGELLLTHGTDNWIRGWSIPDGDPTCTIPLRGALGSLVFSDDHTFLVLVKHRGAPTVVWKYDLERKTCRMLFNNVQGSQLEYRGNKLYSIEIQKTFLKLWDVSSGRELMKLIGFESSFSSSKLSQDGNLLSALSHGKGATLWDISQLNIPPARKDSGKSE